jgi:hypothetical protein
MAPRIPALRKTVAQNDERSLAPFGEMEMDAICEDGAMRNAIDGLRVDRTGLIHSPGGCRAGSGNEFTSLHG